jgi:hypothetical protein
MSHETDIAKMREITSVCQTWAEGDMNAAGSLLRIERIMLDEAPAAYRQPLESTRVDL